MCKCWRAGDASLLSRGGLGTSGEAASGVNFGASIVLPCNVEQAPSLDPVFAVLAEKWGSLDFLVHAIAFSDKNELKGRYADSSREKLIRTMIISCFSFTEAAKHEPPP